MNLQNYYWFFRKAVPDHICDDIRRYGLSLKENIAMTGGYGDPKTLNPAQLKSLKKKRNSDIVWLSETWLYKELHPFINIANRNASWNYQWDMSEACQFTYYRKGQFYDWHCDSWANPYNNPNGRTHGKIRKLSSILLLSDPKDYKGGELEFDYRNMDPDKKPSMSICKDIQDKGDLIVFPSFVWHRVKPLKSGQRYSLVNWHLGWPFK